MFQPCLWVRLAISSTFISSAVGFITSTTPEHTLNRGSRSKPPSRSTQLALQYNPPNRGAPGRTHNAGSRTGDCGNLTMVQPTQTRWGETLEARPAFGIYVSEPVKALEFELKNEASGEVLHRVELDEVDGPGISLYRLPDSVAELQPERLYRWQVNLSCRQFSTNKVQFNGEKTLDGVVIRRLANDELKAKLSLAFENKKPEILALNGLWYDTVEALLRLRHCDPENDDLIQDWKDLITHSVVSLDNLLKASPIETSADISCSSRLSQID